MRPIAFAAIALAGCAESGVVLAVSSEVTPIDRLTLTVLGGHGAIVADQDVSPKLPGRILLDSGERREAVRVLAWGWQADARVAYGAVTFDVAPGSDRTVAIHLTTPPADCDGDWIPDAVDGCRGIADPLQQDDDGDGVTDACTPGAATCPGNLFEGVDDFETGTTGWHPYSPATLVQGPDAHGGTAGGHVCKVGTAGTFDLYTIGDRPHVVMSTTAGLTYKLAAWMRSSTTVAQEFDPSLKEDVGGTQIGDDGGTRYPPTSTWQLVTASYTAQLDGSILDVRFQGENAADTACFDVDDICLVVEHTCP